MEGYFIVRMNELGLFVFIRINFKNITLNEKWSCRKILFMLKNIYIYIKLFLFKEVYLCSKYIKNMDGINIY